MKAPVHVFTSITANYLPKARVLAGSIKRVDPSAQFHLVLCDKVPPGIDLEQEPFDSVIDPTMLGIDNLSAWLFSHTVVELCTGVKGAAVETLFEHYGAEKVFYFDPDMVVFSRFDELVSALDQHSVLLTPHQTTPESSIEAIMDNEMASLKFGVFNLGFLGVRNDVEGRKFSRWWRDRLLRFCHDDRPNGLFTDQKWVNLAPCFFDNIHVLRSPAFNVATWNISQRRVTGSMKDGVRVNGEPLGFYHFSGMDSGAQEIMLRKYGAGSPVLFELRNWYVETCEAQGQSELGDRPSVYASYSDGTMISLAERVLYRQREDLRQAFPDPFAVDSEGGYQQWYRLNAATIETRDQCVSVDPQGGLADMLNAMAYCFQARSALVQNPLKNFLWRALGKGFRTMARVRGDQPNEPTAE